MKQLAISLALVFACVGSCAAVMYHVPDDFAFIQEAILASEDGDTVLIHPGIYEENLDFSGRDIIVGSLFILNAEEAYIDSTVIDGGGEGAVVTINQRETDDAGLIGVTIQNGVSELGGGIYCLGSSPLLWHLIIRDNSTEYVAGQPSGMGGGLYIQGGDPFIDHVKIIRNQAPYGGGVVIRDTDMSMRNIFVIENEAVGLDRSPGRGGGLLVMSGSYRISKSIIAINNCAGGGGGGFYATRSDVTFDEVIVADNSAALGAGVSLQVQSDARISRSAIYHNMSTGEGAGISLFQSSVDVVNSTVTGNTARGAGGGGIHHSGFSAAVVVNSIFWNNGEEQVYFLSSDNSIAVASTDLQDGEDGIQTNNAGEVDWLEGNLDEEPLFVDEDEDDLRLTENSPCIDAGTDYFEYNRQVLVNLREGDYDGAAPDLGLYEFEEMENSVGNLLQPPEDPTLLRVHPNPFNSSVKLEYTLAKPANIRLTILDTAGRIIRGIVRGKMAAGNHFEVWNAEGVPAGLYFGRFEVGNREMVWVKLAVVR